MPHCIGEQVYFGVGFVYIEVPWNGEVAINMHLIAVFDDAQVVQVNPVWLAFFVEQRYHLLQQIGVGFIHNAGYAFAYNTNAGKDDEQAKQQCHGTIHPLPLGKHEEQQTRHQSCGGIGITLQVFAGGYNGQ